MTAPATDNPNSLDLGEPNAALTPSRGDERKRHAKKGVTAADKLSRVLSLNADSTAPRLAEFIEGIVEEFGGPRKAAKEWVAEYRAAKPGSHQRAKMLDQMMKAMGIWGDITGDLGTTDEFDDDEIRAALGAIDLGDDAQ